MDLVLEALFPRIHPDSGRKCVVPEFVHRTHYELHVGRLIKK